MRKYLVAGLLVLNLVLGVLVIKSIFHIPDAKAQSLSLSGNYIMVSGQSIGIPSDVVYLLDLSSRQLTAMTFDQSTGRVRVVGSRDIIRDIGGALEQTTARPPGTIRPRRTAPAR